MMERPKSKKFYLNEKQQYVWQIAPRHVTAIASRRFGKSEGLIMPILVRNVQAMPRSGGAIVGQNYKQILTRTLPATLHAIERLGYKEGVHFYVGRKAPASAGFKEPYIKPKVWDYYVHWYNGSVNALISQDVPFSSNSLTLDYVIADEGKTLNYDKLANETFLANSGLHYFKDCAWHTGINVFSDMPTKKNGMWMLKDQVQMDLELLAYVESLIYRIWEVQEYHTIGSQKNRLLKELNNELNLFRKELHLYVVFNILDNLEIVGQRYIDDQFRKLPPFIFRTALLSMLIKGIEGSFYGALDENIHYYQAYDNSYLNEFRSKYGDIDWRRAAEQSYNCLQDTDIDINKPLYIAFDTNININWVVVGQPDYDKNTLKVLKSLYVKHPRMLTELCNEFADYYDTLPNRDVVFYYDHTFLQGRSGNSEEAFHETITRVLTDRGWNVTEEYIYQAMKHHEKHKLIDDGLKAHSGLFPTFNQPNNGALLLGMEQTGTRVTATGWGKDKSDEKKDDTHDDPVEHRTDGGDAFDTLYIGCTNFRIEAANIRTSLSSYFG